MCVAVLCVCVCAVCMMNLFDSVYQVMGNIILLFIFFVAFLVIIDHSIYICFSVFSHSTCFIVIYRFTALL